MEVMHDREGSRAEHRGFSFEQALTGDVDRKPTGAMHITDLP